ncbi:hypothetical protein OAO01_00715 [Oligoflexia bacterium]|nr:hypothetical protein [Oligoflexia bacterium]
MKTFDPDLPESTNLLDREAIGGVQAAGMERIILKVLGPPGDLSVEERTTFIERIQRSLKSYESLRQSFTALGPASLEDAFLAAEPKDSLRETVGIWCDYFLRQVDQHAVEFAKLTGIQDYNSQSLKYRVPVEGGKSAGLDAGLFAISRMIPEHAREFSARMHANHTPELIDYARTNLQNLDHKRDAPITWWLAACSVVKPGVDRYGLVNQVIDFHILRTDLEKRVAAAKATKARFLQSVETEEIAGVECPIGTNPDTHLRAYLAGHRYAVLHATGIGLYYIGTYESSLGLEDHGDKFSNKTDEQDRPLSGFVGGNPKLAKCCDRNELEIILPIVAAHFSDLPLG